MISITKHKKEPLFSGSFFFRSKGFKKILDIRNSLIYVHKHLLAGSAGLDLKLSVLHRAGTDLHLNRESDKVGIVHLEASPLVPVINQHINTQVAQLLINILCYGADFLVVALEWNNLHLEGSNGRRPDNALVVVVLLYECSQGTCYSDAVATHYCGALLAILVQEYTTHRL